MNDLTHDSYHIKHLNSVIALKEIIEVCEGIISGEIKLQAIESPIKEMQQIIKSDLLLDKYFNQYKKIIQRSICKVPNDISNVYRIMFQLKIAFKKIENLYLIRNIEEIEPAVEYNSLGNIDYLIGSLVSGLISLGWSTESLYLELKRRISVDWDLHRFLTILKKKPEVYVCLYKVRKLPPNDSLDFLKRAGLNIYSGQKIKEDYPKVDLKNFIANDSNYIKKEIEIFDYYSASEKGWEEIKSSFDIVKFYGYKVPELDYKPIVFLPYGEKVVANKEIFQRKILKNHKATERMYEQYFEFVNRDDVSPSAKSRVKQVSQYIRMGEESLSIETMFLNLWVALESFVRSPQFKNDIENVMEVTAAIESHSYIYKLVKNLLEDCQRCKVNLTCENTYKLFQLILSTEGQNELISKCKQKSTLLTYRTERLVKSLASPKEAGKLLEGHHQRIKWHLQRLYRIRNAIVHSANHQQSNLTLFVRHLREYLSSIIPTSIYFLATSNYQTLEEVFSAMIDNYNVTIEILKNDSGLDDERYYRLLKDGALFM